MGKSTLMNHLIGQKIAITSNKPQTTRNRIQTVYTGPKGQIVFLDTPGIHKAKNKLGNYMVKVAESTFSDVDVIPWLVEPTTYIGAGERHILEQLKRSRLPVILVINKIDTVPKTAVLDAMETYRKEMDFAEIVPVSALRSNNTDTLLDCIFKYLQMCIRDRYFSCARKERCICQWGRSSGSRNFIRRCGRQGRRKGLRGTNARSAAERSWTETIWNSVSAPSVTATTNIVSIICLRTSM